MKYSLRSVMTVCVVCMFVGAEYVIYFHKEYASILQRVIALTVCVLAAAGGITTFRSGSNTAMAIIFSLISVGALLALLMDLLYFS